MGEERVLTGNQAAAIGAKLARPEVISAYPITPQSEISENLSQFVNEGDLDAHLFRIESEHSAMSSLIGASLAGVRTFTATSSNGLFYMAEMLHFAAGGRLPIVTVVANRAASPPWNVWGDQTDALSQRDTGWLQLYAEDGQEALDTIIQAYRLAEAEDIRLPVMINLDGFQVTHISEPVTVPDQEDVDEFLPEFDPEHSFAKALENDDPKLFHHITPPEDSFMEYRYRQAQAANRARDRIDEIDAAFAEQFGRSHGGLVEEYRLDDAEIALVTLGSLTTTTRAVVDDLREDGRKVGVLKLRAFRPFPAETVREALAHVDVAGVIEKAHSADMTGPVYDEVSSALSNSPVLTQNFVTGLGGREVTKDHVHRMVDSLRTTQQEGTITEESQWIGVKK
ncbi:MAG: pyruvate ferredoxin oxidoreductase alpha subunit [Haloarculaceae archaeon]|jgi:pyruvate ferredoxin oxidoreductase alpha subunit